MNQQRVVSIYFWIDKTHEIEHAERFEASIIFFAYFLFKNNIGHFEGKGFSQKGGKSEKNSRGTRWLVIDSKKQVALDELKRLSNSFKIINHCHISIGSSFIPSIDYHSVFSNKDVLVWKFTR